MSYSSCRKSGDAKKKNQEKRAKISMQFLRSQISFEGRPRETRENTYWRETISLRSVRKTFPNKTSPDFSHAGAHEIVCRRFHSKADCEPDVRIHTGEKPYPCGVCRKHFRIKHHLTSHMMVHMK